MAAQLPTGLRTHAQRVCSLYKRWCRNVESWNTETVVHRMQMMEIRHEFDKNKDIKDLRVAKDLLVASEKELEESMHPQPKYFPDSPDGCNYQREVMPPDWICDQWHPTEKAMYPKYFALREKRKLEYVKLFDKQYPNAQKEFHDH